MLRGLIQLAIQHHVSCTMALNVAYPEENVKTGTVSLVAFGSTEEVMSTLASLAAANTDRGGLRSQNVSTGGDDSAMLENAARDCAL